MFGIVPGYGIGRVWDDVADRLDDTALFLFDADDQMSSAEIAEVVSKSTDCMHYRFRVPISLIFDPGVFNKSTFDKLSKVEQYLVVHAYYKL